jgi:hypothetical protein
MDSAIIASLIGAVGTVIAAFVTANYGQQAGTTPPPRRRWLPLVIALVALSVAGSIWFLLYDGTYHRINQALGMREGYHKVLYATVGVGFLLPNQWRVDDASFRFAGGDVDLIRDYDPNAASISQGIKLRFLNVQENYVNDPGAEYGNEMEVLSQIDPKVSEDDTRIGGLPGKKFVYTQRTGQRTGYVERTWIHLSPRVKLEILSFSNLDETARPLFDKERDEILQSFVVDQEKVSKLTNDR